MAILVYRFVLCFGMTLASIQDHVFMPADRLPSLGPVLSNSGRGLPTNQKRIMNDVSWPLRLLMLKDYIQKQKKTDESQDSERKVDIQALMLPDAVVARRDDTNNAENEDNNMKMKLFRLMYETVRDSDLKVKRAELIKRSYANSSSFEVGYLMGDITDKFNIMNDIASTLKRLYYEWKPIEHINAYEQIANLGIDVGHIVDMTKAIGKRPRNDHATFGQSTVKDGLPPPELDYFEIPAKQ